jgi:hypothetical protein
MPIHAHTHPRRNLPALKALPQRLHLPQSSGLHNFSQRAADRLADARIAGQIGIVPDHLIHALAQRLNRPGRSPVCLDLVAVPRIHRQQLREAC